jgi:hypothetical protein
MRSAELDDADALRPLRIPLSVNDPNAARTLTRCVERVLRDERGRAPVVLELHGDRLPAALVAAIIANLRRLREVGGALTVNAVTPGLRTAIALHGLDRVLTRAGGSAVPSRRRSSARAQVAWNAFAGTLLLVTIACVAVLVATTPTAFGGP